MVFPLAGLAVRYLSNAVGYVGIMDVRAPELSIHWEMFYVVYDWVRVLHSLALCAGVSCVQEVWEFPQLPEGYSADD